MYHLLINRQSEIRLASNVILERGGDRTGGTGKFQHARGKGSIDIPDPLKNELEYWTGSLESVANGGAL